LASARAAYLRYRLIPARRLRRPQARSCRGELRVIAYAFSPALEFLLPDAAHQRAIVALVFEACLLALMATYELLGHTALAAAAKATRREEGAKNEPEPGPVTALPPRPVAPPRLVSSKPAARSKAKASSNVERFLAEEVIKRDGARLEFKKLLLAYRAWCSEVGETDLAVVPFGTEVGRLVTVNPPDSERRVYCVGIALRRLEEARGPSSEAAIAAS
jgi:hypothetical protein